MKVAYFDLVSGASGDMILGALVDAGLPFAALRDALSALHLPGFELTCERVMRGMFSATKVDVKIADTATARHLPEIEAVITGSDLPARLQEPALRIFRRMIEAEAGIHGQPADHVHLHELGAIDTIVDVTGALLGLDLLGVGRVVASPVPLGRGTLKGSHGLMPLPAPATMALLKGAPVFGVDQAVETVTPTAAALLTELAASFGPIPPMQLTAIGYGAGTRTTPEPNVLRIFLGEASEPAAQEQAETLSMLETNIDNMNPEIYGYVMERLFAAGALDVYLNPIIMKKNRPAVVLTVLCKPAGVAAMREILFAETTTLGVRVREVDRYCLRRRIESVETPYGAVHVKIVGSAGGEEKAAPEYEDCAQAARSHAVPVRIVYEAAMEAYRGRGERRRRRGERRGRGAEENGRTWTRSRRRTIRVLSRSGRLLRTAKSAASAGCSSWKGSTR